MRHLATKYVLYTHYQYQEKEDLNTWGKARKKNKKPSPETILSLEYLREHLNKLSSLLTVNGKEGVLVLFFGPGRSFAELLDGVAEGRSENEIVNRKPTKDDDTGPSDLQFAKYWRNEAKKILQNDEFRELAPRVRLVIPQNFVPILSRLHQIHRERLRFRFVGRKPSLYYDSPKIVEAVVRVRNSGTGIPVLRIDHDVLFTDENKNEDHLGLYVPIDLSLTAYRQRYEDHRVAAFMHSASYDYRQIAANDMGNYPFLAYSTSFATRVHPALPIKKGLWKQNKTELRKDCPKNWTLWDCVAHKSFDEELARQFYGLFGQKGCSMRSPEGIVLIGAHPLYGVISGALLCLSDLAIELLPPFSNFGQNVSWIDDHLKYALHRSLFHFTLSEIEPEPMFGGARIQAAFVRKGRASLNNLPYYTLTQYLPTLLYGTIVDAWICPDPLLKCRYGELSDEGKKRRDEIRQQRLAELEGKSGGNTYPTAPLAEAMKEALKQGNFPDKQEGDLKKALEKSAMERIKEVRQQWAKLRKNNLVTFAAAWADGTAAKLVPKLIKNPREDGPRNNGIGRGIAPGTKVDQDLQLRDLEPDLIIGVINLIDDAVKYIQWTLDWPRIVQTIRSFPYGTFIADPPFAE